MSSSTDASRRRLGRAAALTAAILACALAATAGAGAAAKETITIAMPASLTGAAAFTGVPATQGFELAIAQENASGRLKGRTVKLLKEDDGTDPAQALSLVRRFAGDKSVVFIAGPTGSGTSVAAAPVAQQAKVPLMPVPAKSRGIADAGDYLFQIGAWPGSTEAGAITTVAKDCGVKSVAIVSATDNAAQVQQKSLAEDMFKKLGVQVVDSVTVSSTDSAFTPVVTRILSKKPDAVYVTLYAQQSGNFVAQAKAAGGRNILYVATATSASDTLWKTGGRSVEGMVMDADYDPTLKTKLNAAFRKAYQAKYKTAPDNWAAVGYSAGLVTAAALERLNGKSVTRDSFKDALASLSGKVRVPVVIGGGLFRFGTQGEAKYRGAVLVAHDNGFAGYTSCGDLRG